MELKDHIKTLANRYHPDTVLCRRHLHQHPELSFQEVETQKFIEQKLGEWGISDRERMAGTGVVGLIKGTASGDGKVVALRADMDALPITETNKKDYVSKNTGVMHACGHDVHTSSLLGAARILNELRINFPERLN